MRYMDLEGHTHKVNGRSVDIDIIIRVFVKISHSQSLEIGG